jgi:hypothetical protein
MAAAVNVRCNNPPCLWVAVVLHLVGPLGAGMAATGRLSRDSN